MMDEFGLASIDPLADEIIARSEAPARRDPRAARWRLPARGLQRRLRGADHDRGDRHRQRRRDRDRLRRVVAAERARHQRRAELHPRLRLLRAEGGDRPGLPHNEGAFRPVTSPRRAARSSTASTGGGLGAPPVRPLPAQRHLRRAGPGAAVACWRSADPIWLSVWRGKRQENGEPLMTAIFQVGGTGARATKDGLNTTGFPSGVAGVRPR